MVTPGDVGKTVTDGQRTGVLMAFIAAWEDPGKLPPFRRQELRAFVRPHGGGCEWSVPPSELEPA